MLSCHSAKSKARKTPAVIAYRMVFLFLGNCWPENRVNSKKTKLETANRQKAIAYDPMGTNLTIRLPNPNTTQPSTSNGTAYFLPFPSNIPSLLHTTAVQSEKRPSSPQICRLKPKIFDKYAKMHFAVRCYTDAAKCTRTFQQSD